MITFADLTKLKSLLDEAKKADPSKQHQLAADNHDFLVYAINEYQRLAGPLNPELETIAKDMGLI